MTATAKVEYDTDWVDALNRGDVSAADHMFASDCIIHITGLPEPIVGLEAWKAVITGFLTAFPDMHFTIDERVLSDGVAASRWHARGTHAGPFGPIPATGRPVAINGIILDHVVDGKVKERWEQFDQPVLLQQLGVV